ncbi:MAG TPA: hypothetical protein VLN73_07920 [Alphaproteobacteria bacterium]|nr:hypothetical protein [Alphaproteobacteria bacterium]
MRRMIVAALAGILISGSAFAIDKQGSYVGRFNYACPQVLELYQKSDMQKDGAGVTFNRSFSVIVGWMAGYMSSVNSTRTGKSDFYGNMADEAAWIANYCESNEKSDLMEAMEALTKARTTEEKKKPKSASKASKPEAAKKNPVGPVRAPSTSDSPQGAP